MGEWWISAQKEPRRARRPVSLLFDQRPTTNDQRPTTNDHGPTTNEQRPTTNDQRPTTNDQRPVTADLRLRTSRLGTGDSRLRLATGFATEGLRFEGLRLRTCD